MDSANRNLISRRGLLRASAAAGAGFLLSRGGLAQPDRATSASQSQAAAQAPAFIKNPGDTLNVGIIGVGSMGRILIDTCLYTGSPIPNLKFKAVCDIWPFSRNRAASQYATRGGGPVNQYEDYREMLDKEKDLHAVIVATPDGMHAEHTNACLEAGLHVYCEKEMSNSLEKAKSMVLTQRRTGKLLQIGRQRRSNPRYLYALNNILNKNHVLGRVGQATAQWNRSRAVSEDLPTPIPPALAIAPEVLQKYGYGSMHEFLNWRWFRQYGAGPAVDLGAHQLDVINWFLGTCPKSMTAMGSRVPERHHEWFDNVMCLLEYETAAGPVNVSYQVLTSTGYGHYSETFLGDQGILKISENPQDTALYPDPQADDWESWAQNGIIKPKIGPPPAGADARPKEWQLPVELAKPPYQPHLENFFDAIRRGTPLHCPAATAYATAVTALAINKAVQSGEKIHFSQEDFIVA